MAGKIAADEGEDEGEDEVNKNMTCFYCYISYTRNVVRMIHENFSCFLNYSFIYDLLCLPIFYLIRGIKFYLKIKMRIRE